MATLKQQTISGIKWTIAGTIAQKIFSIATTVVLARILTPADFGLFTLAFVMIDGFSLFKSFGIDSALVRRKADFEKAANTAFLLIPFFGITIFLILIFIAPLTANFFHNQPVANVIRSLAIIFVISCFGKVPQTVIYRNMKFKYKTIAEMSGHLIYLITALTLALNKFGVWSLVIGYILKNFIQISIEWYFSGWRPKFEFDKTIAIDMLHFGKFMFLSSVLSFLYSNLDNIMIGKLLGVAMLGYYGIARNTANILSDYFINKVSNIMYPAYSKIQDNKDDVQRIFLKTIRYVSFLAFPFNSILFIFAPEVLRTVFGEQWLPATGILRILSLVSLWRSLGSIMWPVFLAKGKSKLDLQINLIQIIIFFAFLAPLVRYFQLNGVGYAVLCSSLLSFMLGLIRLKKVASISLKQFFISINPALVNSIFLACIAYILKNTIFQQNSLQSFLIPLFISILLYIFLIHLSDRHIIKEIKSAIT